MKSLKFTASVLALAFITSCSAFPKEDDVHIDYQYEDSRQMENRSVDLQGMTFTVTELSLHNKEYLGVKSSGKGYFFVVKYVLINHSNATRSFDPDHLILVVDTGGQYTVSDYSHEKFSDYTLPITGIGKDETVASEVIYEMPISTNPDTLIVEGMTKGRDQVIDIPLPPKEDR